MQHRDIQWKRKVLYYIILSVRWYRPTVLIEDEMMKWSYWPEHNMEVDIDIQATVGSSKDVDKSWKQHISLSFSAKSLHYDSLPRDDKSVAVCFPSPVLAPVTIVTKPSSRRLLLHTAGFKMVALWISTILWSHSKGGIDRLYYTPLAGFPMIYCVNVKLTPQWYLRW